jgi:pilus assembly protein TadC
MLVAMYYPLTVRSYRSCAGRGEDLVARLRRTVATMRGLREEMARLGPPVTRG